MDLEVKYQGKVATIQYIEFTRELITKNSHDSHTMLYLKTLQDMELGLPNGLYEKCIENS